MEIDVSVKVKEWLAQPNSGPNSQSVMFAMEGYRDVLAGAPKFGSHGRPMFIMGIGKNSEVETAAKGSLAGLQIPVKHCQGGTITLEVTREQLQSVLATKKFRSVRLFSERSAQRGEL